jgi:two-component system, OmpR family, sensor histidine kinase CreC
MAVAGEDAGIRIEVENDGDPISMQNRDRIFDAFFTTRRDSGGTGMGLAIVHSIMASHGGSIALLPATGGVAFELRFPAGWGDVPDRLPPLRLEKVANHPPSD